MKTYQVTGIPLGPSEVAGHAVGDLVGLDLTPEAERALIGAGAIIPQPKPSPKTGKAADGADKPPA